MIKSFRHKGLQRFYQSGSTAGIQAVHAARIRLQLAALNAATGVDDLKAAPGWRLHALKGELKGHHALTVSGNWRLTFCFVGEDVELLDYVDYH
jgi:toxin HigB-1